MYFLNLKDSILGKIYIKKKDVYFKHGTTEQWTGEYDSDGKKIYIKDFSFTTSASDVTAWTNIGANITNLYRLIGLEGFSDDGTQFNTYPRYESGNFYVLITYYSVSRGFVYKAVGYKSKKIRCRVKYTKTS